MWRLVVVLLMAALDLRPARALQHHPAELVEVGAVGAAIAAGAASAADIEGTTDAGGAEGSAPWGLRCPDACTCREGPFREVPLRRQMAALAPHVSLDDEALRAQVDGDRQIRQAMCVVLSHSYEEVLEAIPRDTQALTLLQSADEAAVVLTASLLSPLEEIISLEVTAFLEAGVVLRSDAVRLLTRLRLLSLTGVKLEGALEDDDNEVTVTSAPPLQTRRRRLPPWAYYRTDGHGEEMPELVFLKPSEVVPFSKFSEIRRVNALRTFDGLQNLVLLRLHHADLIDLAWEMFNGLENLQVLSLEHNGLAYVPDWSLYGAPSLRYLSLAHNALLEVSSTALVGLLELRFLDLSHNNLSHLSELSLPPFPKLKGADFRGNPIEAIFTSTFQIMNSTETLLLGGSGTALQLHAGMFLGLRALRRLAATDVTAAALHRDLLRGMPRLRDLTLRGVLSSLPYDAFAEVPKLERLVLRQCSIRHVSMDAFYALYALQELDLSHNQLRSLPPSLLDQQGRLRELLLAGNQLTQLPAGFLDVLPAKMIRLDDNPWECSCDMASWNPTATNKDKREGRYVYEKRAAPTCASPERYAGWDVYDAMRRGFRCNKNPSKRLRLKLNALPPASSTSPTTTSTPVSSTLHPRSNVVPGRDDEPAPAISVVSVVASTGEPVNSTAGSSSMASPTGTTPPKPLSFSSSSFPTSTASSDFFSSTATPESSASYSSESSAADASWSSSSTPSAATPSASSSASGPSGAPHRRGPRRGKHRQPSAPGSADSRKQSFGAAEGSVTKDGKFLLSDGRGGHIVVSKKAFKAAMEERRNRNPRRRFTTGAPTVPPVAA